MNRYYLKLTTLTPVHIGTSEVYEPTNFVIDDGYLYEFDEILFYKSLDENKQKKFAQLVELKTENGYELFEKIHKFILENKQNAIQVAHNRVAVSKKFEQKYKNNIAKKVQSEYKNKKSVFNKFEIQKTQRLKNKNLAYIAGSSVKGSIITAYKEMILNDQGKSTLEIFEKQKASKNLSVSDTLYQKSDSKISFSKNIELFDDDGVTLSTMIEVVLPNSEFLITLDTKNFKDDDRQNIKEHITKEKIIQACKTHYNILFDEKVNKQLQLKPNQFLISVGKHSGARAVTIDGLRKILVKLCQIQNKRDEGDNPEKRVERLYKKSHFESDKIKELFTDLSLLDDKEKKDFNNAKHFIETPSKLENWVRKSKRVTINAILTQETTIWKFEDDDSLDSFGWILCEFIDESEFTNLSNKYQSYEMKTIQQEQEKLQKVRNSIKQQELKKQELIKQKELERQKRVQEEKEQKEADFQKAKESEDIEFLENFVIKYQREDMSFYQDRLKELKAKQKDNKLKSLEETAKKAYDGTLQKKGTKAFKKLKDKYIKKWGAEKNNKGSKYIKDLVEKMQKIT